MQCYNVHKFKDVKNLLNKNDIFVQEITSVYMILFIKDGKYNKFKSLYNRCHETIYEKDTNRIIVESSHLYIPYHNKNSVNTIGLIIFIFFVFVIFIFYKYT